MRQNLQERQQMVKDLYRSVIIGMLWSVQLCICYMFYSIDICFLFFSLFFSSGNFLTWTTSAQIVGVEALRPGIGLPTLNKLQTIK